MNARTIGYWATTGLLSFAMLGSGAGKLAQAEPLVERDIQNVNYFFRRKGAEVRDPEELKEWITGGTEDVY